MHLDLQPDYLQNDLVKLQPLQPSDFEKLYQVASDPLIWEQHPARDRYKRDVFKDFFDNAIESKGAFLILENKARTPIGTSRFYEYEEDKNSVAIGYTFLAKEYWGATYNKAVKSLMLNHAFTLVDQVIFHIGQYNIRSQKAAAKLGVVKIGELEYGEQKKINYVYQLDKQTWTNIAPDL